MQEWQVRSINVIPAKVVTELGLAGIQALGAKYKLRASPLSRSLKGKFYIDSPACEKDKFIHQGYFLFWRKVLLNQKAFE